MEARRGDRIFQHGLEEDRGNLLYVADALAHGGFVGVAIDLPLHGKTVPYNAADPTTYLYASSNNPWYKGLGLPATGSIERTFDLSTINMAAGLPGLDPSGSHYINLASALTQRDDLRESSLDLVTLAESVGTIMLPSPATAPYVNPANVHFIGHSQGAIIGTGFLAVMPPKAIVTATLANPGGKYAYESARLERGRVDLKSEPLQLAGAVARVAAVPTSRLASSRPQWPPSRPIRAPSGARSAAARPRPIPRCCRRSPVRRPLSIRVSTRRPSRSSAVPTITQPTISAWVSLPVT